MCWRTFVSVWNFLPQWGQLIVLRCLQVVFAQGISGMSGQVRKTFDGADLCKILTMYRCHVTHVSYASCNFPTGHILSSLLFSVPITVPKTMTSGLPHSLLLIPPGNPLQLTTVWASSSHVAAFTLETQSHSTMTHEVDLAW